MQGDIVIPAMATGAVGLVLGIAGTAIGLLIKMDTRYRKCDDCDKLHTIRNEQAENAKLKMEEFVRHTVRDNLATALVEHVTSSNPHPAIINVIQELQNTLAEVSSTVNQSAEMQKHLMRMVESLTGKE